MYENQKTVFGVAPLLPPLFQGSKSGHQVCLAKNFYPVSHLVSPPKTLDSVQKHDVLVAPVHILGDHVN